MCVWKSEKVLGTVYAIEKGLDNGTDGCDEKSILHWDWPFYFVLDVQVQHQVKKKSCN